MVPDPYSRCGDQPLITLSHKASMEYLGALQWPQHLRKADRSRTTGQSGLDRPLLLDSIDPLNRRLELDGVEGDGYGAGYGM